MDRILKPFPRPDSDCAIGTVIDRPHRVDQLPRRPGERQGQKPVPADRRREENARSTEGLLELETIDSHQVDLHQLGVVGKSSSAESGGLTLDHLAGGVQSLKMKLGVGTILHARNTDPHQRKGQAPPLQRDRQSHLQLGLDVKELDAWSLVAQSGQAQQAQGENQPQDHPEGLSAAAAQTCRQRLSRRRARQRVSSTKGTETTASQKTRQPRSSATFNESLTMARLRMATTAAV